MNCWQGDGFQDFMETAGRLADANSPHISDDWVVDNAAANAQYVLTCDVVNVLVVRAREVTAGEADMVAWARMADQISRVLGCDTKRQQFAVELLVAAAIVLAQKEEKGQEE